MTPRLKTMTATALLLSLAYAPQALAVTYYDFSAVLNAGLSGGALSAAQRTITMRFTTDAAPTATSGIVNITGISGFLGNATTGTTAQRLMTGITPVPGPNFGTLNLALGTPGTGRITSLSFDFSRATPYSDMPWTMQGASYTTAGLKVNVQDQNADGGNNVGVASFVRVPEIDGGLLPRALFVLSGIFLIAFGRKQTIAG